MKYIAIFPGHHPDDKGAINKNHGLNEHDEAVKIIAHAMPMLEERGFDVTTYTGRLSKKIELVNAGDFDLAIDLHFNADYDHLDPDDLDDSRGTGCMVMHCPYAKVYGDPEPLSARRKQADDMSLAMAGIIGNINRGARPGWWWNTNPPKHKDGFLVRTNCAAFIPEFGYIDNNYFAERYLVAGKHKLLAEALVIGVEAAGF